MELFGLDYIVTAHQRVFWMYVASALCIASIYMIFFQKTCQEYRQRKIWTHPSALMDYKYFFIIAFIKVVFILPLLVSSKDISLWTVLTLQEIFGYMNTLRLSKEFVVVLYTLTLFIVGDLSRYLLHRWLHTLPFLWRFHKVHHSAEVLNPLTFYRVHPVENILFGLRYAVVVGSTTGVFIYLFGANIGLVQIVGVNVSVFIAGILGANLRHSHVPLRYGDFMERIFISPYQHQLHHSVEHSDKNFGGVLAIWDLMFQTLHIEKTRVNIEYGVVTTDPFTTVWEMLFKPFVKNKKLSTYN